MKIVLFAVTLTGLGLTVVFGLLAGVAWADAQSACPDGSQCGAAKGALVFFTGLFLAALSLALVGSLAYKRQG